MKTDYLKILENYEFMLEQQSDATGFFRLLFDDSDSIQVKEHNRVHPADAYYYEGATLCRSLDVFLGQKSDSGAQFCINALPKVFMDKIDELFEIEKICQPQWDALVPELRDALSLSGSLFERGRAFFIEVDKLPNGRDIETLEEKKRVVQDLLSTDLPISYILDTGGRGPHIGIVLEDAVTLTQFQSLVSNVMKRLPSWIDSGVGRVNQLERFPNTLRTNKRGEVVEVKLIYVGERVKNDELGKWIEGHAIINENVKDKPQWEERHWDHDNIDDKEEAAWRFIDEHGLKSSKQIRNDKIQVSCPKTENHKRGDKNMSAVIFVESGHVWCASCQETVGRTFEAHFKRKRSDSPLIQNTDSDLDLKSIKPSKLF